MRTKAYCAYPSIPDHWTQKCLSRCPDQVVDNSSENDESVISHGFLRRRINASEERLKGNKSLEAVKEM
ncbi:hypothetical protein TNCV_4091711 [Trichonephila clavipes]|nr:hypothetical protein TNCV_4091711 [Trichonephila clavipes]